MKERERGERGERKRLKERDERCVCVCVCVRGGGVNFLSARLYGCYNRQLETNV